MALSLSKLLNTNSTSVTRAFESMGHGLLLVTIDFGQDSVSPLHWFLESGKKPPLDVSINSNTGAINSIRFFFQDETLDKSTVKPLCLKKASGIPVFDISIFSKNMYQIFEPGKVNTHMHNNDLYFAFQKNFIANQNISLCLEVSRDISLFFDEHSVFTGFVLKKILNIEIISLQKSGLM